MTLLAVVGIKDPLRSGAPDAVVDCHRAGITVRMVTGDNVETARAVAQEIGILRNNSIIMQGPEFRCLDDGSQRDVLPRLMLLARASPEDKMLLVRLLQRQGETVAVTGGNGSDAFALKLAEVGFSKGISGTDTAIEASDVVLMDDGFSSMVTCIFWSRAARDSHARALLYRLAATCTASVLTFCTATATDLSDSPVLNAVQLLWVTLVTSVSSFAFLASSLTETIRHQQLSPKTTPIITLPTQKMVIGQIISQLVITLLAYFGCLAVFGIGMVPPSPNDQPHRNTFVFNTFVWLQIFNIVNSQRLDNRLNIFEGTSRHSLYFLVGGLIAGGQVLIVFIGGKAFKVVPLDAREWVISIVLGTTSLLSGALLRLLPDFLIDNLTPASMKRRSRAAPSPTPDLEDTNGDWN
jgi:Ca2+-transporting ATPase